jgi:hypothetical protein
MPPGNRLQALGGTRIGLPSRVVDVSTWETSRRTRVRSDHLDQASTLSLTVRLVPAPCWIAVRTTSGQ